MRREIDGHQVWGAVERAGTGPYILKIYVKPPSGGLVGHELTGFHPNTADEATDLVLRHVEAVEGVNSDLTLRFR